MIQIAPLVQSQYLNNLFFEKKIPQKDLNINHIKKDFKK